MSRHTAIIWLNSLYGRTDPGKNFQGLVWIHAPSIQADLSDLEYNIKHESQGENFRLDLG